MSLHPSRKLKLPLVVDIELLKYLSKGPAKRWSNNTIRHPVKFAVTSKHDGFQELLDRSLIEGEGWVNGKGWGTYQSTNKGEELLKQWEAALPFLKKVEELYKS